MLQVTVFWKDFGFFIWLPIIILGIFGNITIIIYFLKFSSNSGRNMCSKMKKMSTYHFTIVLLAIIDLVVIIFRIPIFFKENLASIACLFVSTGSVIASCWILVVLSYERYRGIVHSFNNRKRLKKRLILLICIIVWIVSILVLILPTISIMFSSAGNKTIADINDSTLIRGIFTFIVQCILPSMALTFFYWRINNYTKAITRQLKLQPMSSDTAAPTTHSSDNSTQHHRNKENNKANKILRNLVILYSCLVWPPQFFIVIGRSIIKGNISLMENNLTLVYVLMRLFELWSIINNVVNVFIYIIMIRKFRSFLWKIISCGKN